jgi:hypothetical protein
MLTHFSTALQRKRPTQRLDLSGSKKTNGFKDLLERHYPTLAAKIPVKQSAFKPYGTKDEALLAWDKAAKDSVIDSDAESVWADAKETHKRGSTGSWQLKRRPSWDN